MKKQHIKLTLAIIISISLGAVLNACNHQPTAPTNANATVCFKNEVLPIFVANCGKSGCHSSKDTTNEESFPLDNYNSIIKYVTPGDAKNSKVYMSIIRTWSNPMPPKPLTNITQENRTIIALWIEQGANNTSCP